jgi:hypothetical protein
MADTIDPGELVKKLAQRLGAEAAKAGFTLRGFSFVPNMEGDGPHTVQAAFTLDIDLDATEGDDVDQAQVDAEFERMMANQREADRIREARERLERQIAEGGGILDDDD